MLKVIATKEKLRGPDHLGQVVPNFFSAAAGEQGDPGFRGVEGILGCELFARDGGQGQFGEGMADKLGGDAVLAVELCFKGEDDKHFVDVALNQADAVLFPGPELGADEENDRNSLAVELREPA